MPDPLRPPAAVVFDVDGTLVHHDRAMRVGLARHLASHGVVAQEADHVRWREIQDEYFVRYLAGELTFDEQRRARVRAFTGQTLDDAEVDAWVAGNVACFEAALTLYDDTVPALARLAAVDGVVLAALSNVSGDFTRRKLGLVGVLDRFELVLGHDELGAAKPDPRCFAALAERLGLPASEVAHVGDRWGVDAAPAAAAGMRAVWLDRPGVAAHERHPPPDGAAESAAAGVSVVGSLLEVAGALGLKP